jgi:glycosyltransferase involved in cell wall biosynthesis
MMKDKKLVSVIIPTYKRPDTLPRALESVLKQSYNNIEIIVVDDNDPEWHERVLTEQLMESYLNQNVHYVKHERNKNGSAARNTGFRHSKGAYIMFLDDDDEFTEHKVEEQVKKLDALDKSWGACYTNYVRKKNGKVIVRGAEKREGALLSEELMRNLFVHAGSNLMIRREVVEEINGFDESFTRNQDVEFLTRILMKYKLAYVDIVGLIVHVSDKVKPNINFEKITTEYLSKFYSYIDILEKKDRDNVYRMINLQLFRNFLLTKGKRKKAISLIVKNDISFILALRYIFHLITRKVTKKAYGFRI